MKKYIISVTFCLLLSNLIASETKITNRQEFVNKVIENLNAIEFIGFNQVKIGKLNKAITDTKNYITLLNKIENSINQKDIAKDQLEALINQIKDEGEKNTLKTLLENDQLDELKESIETTLEFENQHLEIIQSNSDPEYKYIESLIFERKYFGNINLDNTQNTSEALKKINSFFKNSNELNLNLSNIRNVLNKTFLGADQDFVDQVNNAYLNKDSIEESIDSLLSNLSPSSEKTSLELKNQASEIADKLYSTISVFKTLSAINFKLEERNELVRYLVDDKDKSFKAISEFKDAISKLSAYESPITIREKIISAFDKLGDKIRIAFKMETKLNKLKKDLQNAKESLGIIGLPDDTISEIQNEPESIKIDLNGKETTFNKISDINSNEGVIYQKEGSFAVINDNQVSCDECYRFNNESKQLEKIRKLINIINISDSAIRNIKNVAAKAQFEKEKPKLLEELKNKFNTAITEDFSQSEKFTKLNNIITEAQIENPSGLQLSDKEIFDAIFKNNIQNLSKLSIDDLNDLLNLVTPNRALSNDEYPELKNLSDEIVKFKDNFSKIKQRQETAQRDTNKPVYSQEDLENVSKIGQEITAKIDNVQTKLEYIGTSQGNKIFKESTNDKYYTIDEQGKAEPTNEKPKDLNEPEPIHTVDTPHEEVHVEAPAPHMTAGFPR